MKTPCKISVIMPVYNTEKYVGQSIESILSQSYEDFEFIIIDDCSTDQSYQICQDYAKQDGRIRLYRNEENRGISYTRNKLMELSTGDFIVPQDSDDVSLPDRLSLCYDFLYSHDEYAVVSGNNIIIDSDSGIIGTRVYSDNIKKVILKKSPISQPSSMFRRDVFLKLGGYDSDLNYGEDYDLWLRFYAHGYKIKNLPDNLIKYRIHEHQSKSEKLKVTLRNTIFIQKRAIKKGITPSYGDSVYIFIERILLFFPDSFILWLFKKIEYKNAN